MNNRFFYPGPFDRLIQLQDAEFHHLARVMRAHIGDEVELVNGQGSLAIARVDHLDKESATLLIQNIETHPRPFPSIILGLPILKIDRLEWAIEKATELGADAIHLFRADYSEKKELTPHQHERLRLITISAMKQCGRLYLPEIRFYASLQDAFIKDAHTLYGDLSIAAPKLTELPHSKTLFFSGPEKGFSPIELEFLKKHAHGIHLHENVLRAETAPLVALSLLTQQRIAP